MNNEGVAKDDVKVPDSDLGKQIQEDFENGKDLLVTIISAMSEEQVCSVLLPPSPFLIFFVGHLRQGGPKRRSMTQFSSSFLARDICCVRLIPSERLSSSYILHLIFSPAPR